MNKSAPRRRAMAELTPAWLEQAALAHLARFATSGPRLARLLEAKLTRAARRLGMESEPSWRQGIAALITRLEARGLLDDGLYAEAKARRLQRQGQPGAAIARALQAEGLTRAQAATALGRLAVESSDGAAGDLAAAIAYVRRRRLGPYRPEAERARHAEKDLAALARRGFARLVADLVLAADNPEALAGLLRQARAEDPSHREAKP